MRNLLYTVALPLVFVAFSTTVSITALAGSASNLKIDLRCDPVKNVPTPDILNLWIGTDVIGNYDGGFVPYSALHQQGYEVVLDAQGNVFLEKLNAPEEKINIGVAELATQPRCTWEETATVNLIPNPYTDFFSKDETPGPCVQEKIDDDVSIYRPVKRTFSFTDDDNSYTIFVQYRAVVSNQKQDCGRDAR